MQRLMIERRGSILKDYALSFIHNNDINELNPYTVLLSTSGGSIGSITMVVVETDGKQQPKKIDSRCRGWKRLIREWCNVHVGTTKKCAFQRYLPDVLALRDRMNLIHRVKLKKQKLTVEIIQSFEPQYRQELIEAACLAAI